MTSQQRKILLWWHNTSIYLRMGIFLAGCLLLALMVYLQRPELSQEYIAGNLLVFVLVNLNIATLVVLAFVVGRNIVKLIFDRRRKIFGSKLRLRLVIAFVGLTLIPTTILFVLASGLLNNAMEGWFGSWVETSVEGAVKVAKYHYTTLEERVGNFTQSVEDSIETKTELNDAEFIELLDNLRRTEEFYSIRLLDREGKEIAVSENAAARVEAFTEPEPSEESLQQAREGQALVLFEEKGANQFVRGYRSAIVAGKPVVLITTLRVQPGLTEALGKVNESYKEYKQLKLFENPLRSGYLLTLTMITVLILFSAIWFGFYIAREISIPIQKLAEGTRSVARGNYNVQIKPLGDDEIGTLVKSFNQMTKDIKFSREESERRKLFIETTLANLAVAVIGIDAKHNITTINEAALSLFGIKDDIQLLGRDIAEVIPESSVVADVMELIRATEEITNEELQSNSKAEREIRLLKDGIERKVLCTVGRNVDHKGNWLGTVILFDDITDLSKAQQMSAWRDVARRIAHEIKNPLTPIQLCAQRLQNLVKSSTNKDEMLESTQTIVEHVDSIKRLANEFSKFARMPTAEFRKTDLNQLISDAMAPYSDQHVEFVFQFIADSDLPKVMLDPEQIRRLLINLIDNAIAALKSNIPDSGGRIYLKTQYLERKRLVRFEVSDNGTGIPDRDKPRVFEPYFTKKEGGTGLGLAIVTTVVLDHQGTVRVKDNVPAGTRFIIEIPIAQREVTQRRFAHGE